MNIIHDQLKNEFYTIEDSYKAYVIYKIDNNTFDIISTFVPEQISGRQIAKQLVEHAYKYAYDKKYSLKGSCSYANIYLQKNADKFK